MNIDLLRTKSEQYALVCDSPLPAKPQAAIFDKNQGVLSLEFGNMHDALVCNVAVAEEWRLSLALKDTILIGVIENKVLTMAEKLRLASIL